MARIDNMRLWRARMSGFTRAPSMLVILLAADLAELVASIGLALAAPPPAAPRYPHVAFDVPVTPTQLTLGVALMGTALGLFVGAGLVAELWILVRRAQVFSWRYGRATLRGRARAVSRRS